jgi:hypothetical protein
MMCPIPLNNLNDPTDKTKFFGINIKWYYQNNKVLAQEPFFYDRTL